MDILIPLVKGIIGLLAMVMMGRATISWLNSGQFQQAQKSLLAVLVLLIMYGVVDIFSSWKPDTSPAGEQALLSSLFPDGYAYKSNKDEVSANDANVAVNGLATVGNTIAHGIWGGISSGLPVLGGASLVALFAAIFLIVAFKTYFDSHNLIKLIQTILLLIFLLSAVVGPPERMWFPRNMLRLCNEVMTPIASALFKSFDKFKTRRDFHIISDAELQTAANHARIYPRIRQLGQIYVDGCRAQGIPIEKAQMVGATAQGNPIPEVRDKILIYAPRVTDGSASKATVTMGEFITGAQTEVTPKQSTQSLPDVLLSTFDTSSAFAVYMSGTPKDFIAQFCVSTAGKPVFFAPVSELPSGSDRDLWNRYGDTLVATQQNTMPISIGVFALDDGTPLNGNSAIEKSIREYYYGTSKGGGVIQAFFDQRQAEYDRKKAGRQQAQSSQTAEADAAFERENETLKQWIRPPVVTLLLPQQQLKIGDAYSIGGLFRAALEASSASETAGVSDHPLVGRNGPSLERIMTNREFENPDAWGAILRGISDGSVDRITKNLGGTTDYTDPQSGYAERFLMPTVRNYILPREYQSVSKEALPVVGFFSTGPAREFADPAARTSDVPEQSWFSRFVGAVTGLMASIASFGIYYFIRVAAEALVPLALAWGPFIVGAGIMFVIGFWPIIALVSMWPGRATIILDWVKAVLWVMSWVPVIFLGRCIIESTGLLPSSYTYAVMMQYLGIGIIMGAPVISRIVISPNVSGLEGIAQWSTRTAIGAAGTMVGAGVGLAAGGLAAGVAGAAAVGALGAQAGGKAGSEDQAGSGGSKPPEQQRTVGGSGAPAGAPAGGGGGGEPTPAASEAGGGGNRSVGAPPGGGMLATAQAFLSGGMGGAVREAGGQAVDALAAKETASRGGAALQAAGVSAASQAVTGLAKAAASIMPQSPVAAGDRMAQAAVAAWGGDTLAAKSQWQGYGSEMSNRDVRGGAAGGIAAANRAISGAKPDLRQGVKGLSQAMASPKNLSQLRAVRSLGSDVARAARSEARGAAPADYAEAQGQAAYGEAVAADADDAIADHPEATPAERESASTRASASRARMASHFDNAQAAAAKLPNGPERQQIDQLLAQIEQRIASLSNRAVGGGPKG